MTDIRDVLSGKSHGDENFPVASRVIAARHRAPILAFYRFVRAADDVADHPSLAPAEKHRLLDRLEAALSGTGTPEPEAEPLRLVIAQTGLPAQHALDLLTAFRRDVDKPRTTDWDDLIDYCRYSAMPVGRFVLDVHGEDRALWPANDALCAALQIINHLQDCGKDFTAIDRVYLPADVLARHGARLDDLGESTASPALRRVIVDLSGKTGELLAQSARFALAIGDFRLSLEVAAIQRLAERLNAILAGADPLAGKVHLGKAGFLLTAADGMARQIVRRLLSRSPRNGP